MFLTSTVLLLSIQVTPAQDERCQSLFSRQTSQRFLLSREKEVEIQLVPRSLMGRDLSKYPTLQELEVWQEWMRTHYPRKNGPYFFASAQHLAQLYGRDLELLVNNGVTVQPSEFGSVFLGNLRIRGNLKSITDFFRQSPQTHVIQSFELAP